MTLDPSGDTPKKTRRHVAAQSRFTSSAPEIPGSVSAHEAARDGEQGKQPWIAAMCYQPEKQQVSTTGQRQRNRRGVDDGNREKPQGSEVREPMRHQRAMRCGRKEQCQWPKRNAHRNVDQAVRLPGIRCGQSWERLEGPLCAERLWTPSIVSSLDCIFSDQLSEACL